MSVKEETVGESTVNKDKMTETFAHIVAQDRPSQNKLDKIETLSSAKPILLLEDDVFGGGKGKHDFLGSTEVFTAIGDQIKPYALKALQRVNGLWRIYIIIRNFRTVMEYNDLCRELKRLLQDNAVQPNPQLLEWVTEASNQLSSLKTTSGIEDDRSNYDEHDNEIRNATDSIDRLHDLQAEKKRLLNDLSEKAGTQLTSNNPGIANLGDDNRPSKMSERFSELYDNQWTDAMEALDGLQFDEKESIQLLIRVIHAIYELCKLEREKRVKLFMSLALNITSEDSNETEDVYQNFRATCSSVTTPVEEIKLECSRYLSVKDVLYFNDKTTKEDFFKTLNEKFNDEKQRSALKNKSVKHYVDKCIEICWLLCLQIPPIVMVIDQSNPDYFRSYTRSGDNIEYIVWPALLLHDNGPVLYKGVAQMYADDQDIYENTATKTKF